MEATEAMEISKNKPTLAPAKRGRGRPRKYPLPQVVTASKTAPEVQPPVPEHHAGTGSAQVAVPRNKKVPAVVNLPSTSGGSDTQSRDGTPAISSSSLANPPTKAVGGSSLKPTMLPARRSSRDGTPVISSSSLANPSAKADGGSSLKPTMLPARRSSRQTTVHATQVSEGTLRPPGPPHLEAALDIAISNLESETWGFLALYFQKNPNGPLPTPSQMKAVSTAVRRSATDVDNADRELSEAVDDMMRENAKKKRRIGPVLSKHEKPIVDSETSTRSSTPMKETVKEGSRASSRQGHTSLSAKP